MIFLILECYSIGQKHHYMLIFISLKPIGIYAKFLTETSLLWGESRLRTATFEEPNMHSFMHSCSNNELVCKKKTIK